MNLRGILAALGIGFRGRMGIRLAVIGSILAFALVEQPLARIGFLLVFLASAEAMVILESGNLVDLIRHRFRIHRFTKWTPMPDMEHMAYRLGVKLHKTKPFGVSTKPIGAVALPWSKQIIFGSDVMALPTDQRMAVAGHEMNHLTGRQLIALLIGIAYMPALVAIPLSGLPALFQGLALVALFLVFRSVIGRALEYGSDQAGMRVASRVAMESALRALVPADKHNVESDTHPSVSARIARLRRIEIAQGLPGLLRWLLPTPSLEELNVWMTHDLPTIAAERQWSIRQVVVALEITKIIWRLAILGRFRR